MPDRRLAVDAWESLFRAQHEVLAEISVDFEGSELGQGEYDVLLAVTRAAGRTARLRDITRGMLISQPSVSRLIDRMAASGLITKGADPLDGRGALVTATEAGVRAFDRIARRHAVRIAERMSRLTDDELATLLALTTKLRAEGP